MKLRTFLLILGGGCVVIGILWGAYCVFKAGEVLKCESMAAYYSVRLSGILVERPWPPFDPSSNCPLDAVFEPRLRSPLRCTASQEDESGWNVVDLSQADWEQVLRAEPEFIPIAFCSGHRACGASLVIVLGVVSAGHQDETPRLGGEPKRLGVIVRPRRYTRRELKAELDRIGKQYLDKPIALRSG